MGKFNSNKKVYRVDPLGLGPMDDEDDNNNNNGNNFIMNDNLSSGIQDPLKLLEMIDSPETTERDFAFRTVSEFVLDHPSFVTKLSEKVNLLKVMAHLSDPDVQVRVSAIGTFRNLTIVKEDIVQSLIDIDIVTSLISILFNSLNMIKGCEEKEMKSSKLIEEQHVLIQTLALLTNLIELSEKLFKRLSDCIAPSLVTLFNIILKHQLFVGELIFTISEFLSIITEDNVEICKTIPQELLTALFQLVKESPNMSLKLKTMTSITLFNVGSLYSRDLVIQGITPLLLSCFNFTPIQALKELKDMVDQTQVVREQYEKEEKEKEEKELAAINKNAGADENMDQDKEMVEDVMAYSNNNNGEKKKKVKTGEILDEMEKKLKNSIDLWKENLSALQSSIEIFTNILSFEEENGTPQDNPYDDDDKFLDVEDGNTSNNNNEELSSIGKFLSTTTLCQNLVVFITSISDIDLSAIAKSCPELVSNLVLLKVIYKRSITCLSNLLILYIPKDNALQQTLWDLLVKIAGHSITTSFDSEVIEMTTSSLWSIMRFNPSIGFTKDSEVKSLIELGAKSPSSVKTNLIGIIGISGQNGFCQPILGEIGMFLLQCLNKDEPAEIISEALNSIFDVFAESPINTIFNQLNMLQHLEAFVPVIRNKIKLEKKKLDRSLLDRLDESRINLTRFISYKKSQK
ncbi:hypothetical protein CYY_003828 [Polysphondylium violaceum]|uniref:SYO1-like TPR repeats domain-containing protein n=1 Tax=Polysphondylium violaceum TaxID=133409 RepID=A0A8J4PVN3_9MYCE|nr:hypothetical protein CYY_003828 [Polysphondylium violaceum]